MLQEIQIVPDNVWKIDWLVEVVRRASDNFEKGLSVTQTDMKTPWRKRKVRQLLHVLCRVCIYLTCNVVGRRQGQIHRQALDCGGEACV